MRTFQVDLVISMIIPLALRYFCSHLVILIQRRNEAKRGGYEEAKGQLKTRYTTCIESAQGLNYLIGCSY